VPTQEIRHGRDWEIDVVGNGRVSPRWTSKRSWATMKKVVYRAEKDSNVSWLSEEERGGQRQGLGWAGWRGGRFGASFSVPTRRQT
jgi:hypothetical protein